MFNLNHNNLQRGPPPLHAETEPGFDARIALATLKPLHDNINNDASAKPRQQATPRNRYNAMLCAT